MLKAKERLGRTTLRHIEKASCVVSAKIRFEVLLRREGPRVEWTERSCRGTDLETSEITGPVHCVQGGQQRSKHTGSISTIPALFGTKAPILGRETCMDESKLNNIRRLG